MWIEFKLQGVEPTWQEKVILSLFEMGANGVDETFASQGILSAYFEKRDRERVEKEVSKFLEALPAEALLSEGAKYSFVDLPEVNWADRWKEHFKAQDLGRRFFLKPVWETETKVPDGRMVLLLEPGQAFGTGLHASTRLCIEALESILVNPVTDSGLSLLDVGTGTGILSMVARKLGVEKICAIDNDPIAIGVAQKNFELNDCPGIDLSDNPLSKSAGIYDIIVSNILLETHRKLMPEYRKRLAVGGRLILSGLLADQLCDVESLFFSEGLSKRRVARSEQWIVVTCTQNK